VSEEPSEEQIEQRQGCAEGFFGCLLNPWTAGCFPVFAFVVVVVPYWII
jgi:hypothetical protein